MLVELPTCLPTGFVATGTVEGEGKIVWKLFWKHLSVSSAYFPATLLSTPRFSCSLFIWRISDL